MADGEGTGAAASNSAAGGDDLTKLEALMAQHGIDPILLVVSLVTLGLLMAIIVLVWAQFGDEGGPRRKRGVAARQKLYADGLSDISWRMKEGGPALSEADQLLSREEREALITLGLGDFVTRRSVVRARYAERIKALHPDANGGRPGDPAEVAAITAAWRVISRSPNFHG